MLDKLNGQPVTRAWENRLARIEQRITESQESNEQRVLVLRDALGDFIRDFVSNKLSPLHDEIVSLKKSNAALKKQLHEKSSVDQQVAEITNYKRLDAQASARDAAKRGPKGERGERGARGERGLTGARGPAGKPAISVHSWHVDKYRVTPILTDGSSSRSLLFAR
jgi:hypothetical protein